MRFVQILSGGLDSATCLYNLVKQGNTCVKALTFDYGQRHVKEIDAAKAVASLLKIEHEIVGISNIAALAGNTALTGDIDVPEGHYEDKSMKSTVVPNRNLLFAVLAAMHAQAVGAQAIALGVHAGDHAIYPDCRPMFIDALRVILGVSHYEPTYVLAPYLNESKNGIAHDAVRLGVPFELTWTCYKGGDKHCGKCGACQERIEAEREAGIYNEAFYE